MAPEMAIATSKAATLPALADRAPWAVHSLGASPWSGMWPFNPSIIRTPDDRWLCSIRCANYHLPGSGVQPSRSAGPIRNRTLLITLEPGSWRITRAVEMIDHVNAKPSRWSRLLGFEDLRLAWTNADGLCAVAAAMALPPAGENPRANVAGTIEQVALVLDEHDHIIDAEPLRGAWSVGHQKNWSVFQGTPELRLLYSPLGGGVHDRNGRVIETHDPPDLDGIDARLAPPAPVVSRRAPGRDFQNGAMDVKIVTGRTPPAPQAKHTRLALRGGTQLVEIAPDRWLGLAHGCYVGGAKKFYWHQTTLHDGAGNLLALSAPYKLRPNVGIEFAAGLAIEIDKDLAVISFGVEDDSANLGVTTISGLLDTLEQIR